MPLPLGLEGEQGCPIAPGLNRMDHSAIESSRLEWYAVGERSMKGSAWICVWLASSCSLGLLGEPRVGAQEAIGTEGELPRSGPPKFLRLTDRAGKPLAMEVAVVRYQTESAEGATVDLVGAVHVGEASYYEQLNDLFDTYDAVLYELVAPEGTVIPKVGSGVVRKTDKHPIAILQNSAREVLGLHSQLERVDYSKQHFVRADLTPEQMAAKMAERGDTSLTVVLSALADGIRQQNLAARRVADGERPEERAMLATDVNWSDVLGDPLKLKQTLAKQLANSGSLDQSLGSTLHQILVVDRNAAAAKVLHRELAAGKKRVALFYGAAHMPDFHSRLVNDLGLKPVSVRWFTAWDLTRSRGVDFDNPMSVILRLLGP